MATSDGGSTWTAQPEGQLGATASLVSVSFPDATHGWAVGTSGGVPTVYSTSNGGASWSPKSGPLDDVWSAPSSTTPPAGSWRRLRAAGGGGDDRRRRQLDEIQFPPSHTTPTRSPR